jgi:CPA2 family monovalent cation:H+ antiporter-2
MAAPGADLAAYKEVILFLATAGVVVPLATRMRISPVLGFIGAGALLGPYGLGRLTGELPWLGWVTIPNRSEVSHLAELGVVFLLFMIGIEISWERLRVLRRLVFGLGGAQVAACALAISTIAILLGITPIAAVLGGLALALSSTAIVIPALATQKRLGSPTGRATFAVLLFQDLAVAPVLFAIAALDVAVGGSLAWNLFAGLGQAGIALAAIVLIGRLAMRPLFSVVAQTRSSELFMATSFLVVIVAAMLAAASGLSMALGAFVAGLLLAETEYRRAIEAVVDPFQGASARRLLPIRSEWGSTSPGSSRHLSRSWRQRLACSPSRRPSSQAWPPCSGSRRASVSRWLSCSLPGVSSPSC